MNRLCYLLPLLLLAGCSAPPANDWQGYVEGEYVYLAAPQGGVLQSLSVERGTAVLAGAALFRVDATSQTAGVSEAEARARAAAEQTRNLATPRRDSERAALIAQRDAARAAVALSEHDYQRQQKLAAQGFVSPARVDEARAARDQAQAQQRQAEAQLALAESALGREAEQAGAREEQAAATAVVTQRRWQADQQSVRAPAAGVINDTMYRVGEWVPAGSPVVALLPPQNRVVRFYVPQDKLDHLHVGQQVQVRCDGCAAPISATVRFVSDTAEYTPPVLYNRDQRSRLVFRIEARTAGKEALRLHPGQPVEVSLAGSGA